LKKLAAIERIAVTHFVILNMRAVFRLVNIEPGRVSRTVLPFLLLLLLLLCLCDSSIVNVVGRVYSESRKSLGFRTRLRRYNTPAVRRSVIIWRPHFQSRISLAPYSVEEGGGI
jgi:hypothetical protein